MPSQRRRVRIRRFLEVLFLFSVGLCVWLGPLPISSFHSASLDGRVTAQPTSPTGSASQPLQQGLSRYQAGDFQGAIDIWQAALKAQAEQRPAHSTVLENETNLLKYLAKAHQQMGQADQTIAYLERAITIYRRQGNQQPLGRLLTEQAQVYSSLGQHRRAVALLCGTTEGGECSRDSALALARNQQDVEGEIAALGSLGNAHRFQGAYEQAMQELEASLKLATQIERLNYRIAALNSLGNLYASIARRDARRTQFATQSDDSEVAQKFKRNAADANNKALEYFEASLNLARSQADLPGEIRALLNLVLPYHRAAHADAVTQASTRQVNTTQVDTNQANAVLEQALKALERLPESRDKAYMAMKLANLTHLVALPPADSELDPTAQCLSQPMPASAVALLNRATTIAQQIGDRQAESYALGRLGHVAECQGKLEQALSLTQQAELAAVTDETLYLWQWQAGRIFKAQGRKPESLRAYEQSVQTLRKLRGTLAVASRDFQFDFRDTVDPVYRELAQLRLEQAVQPSALAELQKDLESALETIDGLRLAELENYFGDECSLETIAKPVSLVAAKTAVFNSILFRDRVALILTLPSSQEDSQAKGNSRIHWLQVSNQELTATVNDFRLKLEKRSDLENAYRAPARQLYDWLIRPFSTDLAKAQIDTLVFIQDGILRSIPMSTLHDGQQFLVEQYAIANTPSLTLVEPTQLQPQDLRVLAFGLTKPSVIDGQTFFEPLNQVKSEIDGIATALPGSKGLLDDQFTPDRLQQELQRSAYPVIHLATHGKFGIDARETFLVTGKLSSPPERNNQKLTMNELYQIISNTRRPDRPLELLALTACETAAGSDRDALGIAGISLQAGARSAVASLWQVDDRATEQLIVKFYQGLQQGLSRAKALQVAQRDWLATHARGRYRHPGYWAPFILVGSWL
ncbi:CHAT domain-containing protein [Leptolyngbya sp. FACHB-261]|uniref:CHAT domain-containing protein n=1 Tax=Leptolyngbya sp. FACHB-261 TaxID=2692806 RepID=UPI0016894023|nr:CHAT domain-containing protein [Leptolyngbya sp. FACHB-261]MBD2102468.1 CHAT domain-containing protein [Leptolyngbya sp. FACHB-261]